MSQLSLEKKPVIGISADIMSLQGTDRHIIRDSYVSAVLAAGGAPLLIPCTGDEAATYALFRCLDGLLLTGGGDVDPARYQESLNGTEVDGVVARRDDTELWLAKWAVAEDLPLLGICRGHQVLNVALGGSLYQDIPSQVAGSQVDHRGSTYTHDRGLLTHEITIQPNCKLSAIFGTSTLMVNSLHHQNVKEIGQGLSAVATAPDGLVEGLENFERRWVVSVQWHPEELWRKQGEASRLFQAFVEAARVSSRQFV